jgi:hypothetical protein
MAAAVVFFAVLQAIIIALYHFGEVDKFWWIVLEVIWVIPITLILLGKWVKITWGSGV